MPQSQQSKPIYLRPWVWILAIIVIFALWIVGTYNNLISLRVGVDNSWAQVQVNLQRRYDLIPNLVNTVTLYMSYENATLVQITQLRSQWAVATNTEQQVQTTNQLEAALSKLLVDVENYPNLQATKPLLDLQDELAGTENRIAVSRMDYNNAVAAYNAAILYFPGSFIANAFGFTPRTYFNATTTAATTVPTVPGTIV